MSLVVFGTIALPFLGFKLKRLLTRTSVPDPEGPIIRRSMDPSRHPDWRDHVKEKWGSLSPSATVLLRLAVAVGSETSGLVVTFDHRQTETLETGFLRRPFYE